MKPVLIYKDTEKIKQWQLFLSKCVQYSQELYDLLKSVGIEITLQDIREVLFQKQHHNIKPWIKEFLTEKYIEKAGSPNFNGVPISRQKLKDMIELPNQEEILTFLTTTSLETPGVYFRPELFEIKNGVVSAKSTAFTTIENENTHYSSNDRGAELATMLFDISSKLNVYNEHVKQTVGSSGVAQKIAGLILNRDGAFSPDLEFIRKEEKLYPDYRVK